MQIDDDGVADGKVDGLVRDGVARDDQAVDGGGAEDGDAGWDAEAQVDVCGVVGDDVPGDDVVIQVRIWRVVGEGQVDVVVHGDAGETVVGDGVIGDCVEDGHIAWAGGVESVAAWTAAVEMRDRQRATPR